jgi:hypothetical protein
MIQEQGDEKDDGPFMLFNLCLKTDKVYFNLNFY